MDAAPFTVTLHHLTPDAKRAVVDLPDTALPPVTEKRLRELIRALAAVAAQGTGAAAPELRVGAPQGKFIVQIAQGRLRINSWDIRVGGSDFSPDQIFGLITGVEASLAGEVAVEPGTGVRRSRRAVLALLIAGIVGSNIVTAWLAMREPPNPFLPEFTVLAPEQAERLFASLIGDFQTGTNPGDRGLRITRDRHVRWIKFGPAGAIAETADVEVQAVQSRGHAALLADARALIDVPDLTSVVFYNETYRRKTP